jgi:hypothetical protein
LPCKHLFAAVGHLPGINITSFKFVAHNLLFISVLQMFIQATTYAF